MLNQVLKEAEGVEHKWSSQKWKERQKREAQWAWGGSLYFIRSILQSECRRCSSVHTLSASSPPFPQRKSLRNHLLSFFDVKNLMSFWGLSLCIKKKSFLSFQIAVIIAELSLRTKATIVLWLLKWTWAHSY